MILTKQQISDLYEGLLATQDIGGAKFAYAVARNISKLKSEIESLQKSYQPKAGFNAFELERIKLADKHAKKVDGQPQFSTVDGVESYVMEDKEAFEKDLQDLVKKHQKVVDERRKQVRDFKEILKEETNVDLYMVKSENLPENITAKQISGILPILTGK